MKRTKNFVDPAFGTVKLDWFANLIILSFSVPPITNVSVNYVPLFLVLLLLQN